MRRKSLLVAVCILLASVIASIFFVKRQQNEHHPTAPISSTSASPLISATPLAPKPSWPTPFSVELRGLPPKEKLPPGTLRILVLGDSVAKFLGLAMRYRQDEKQTFVAERGVGSCSIFAPEPYIENGKKLLSSSCSLQWAADVAELHPDVTFIVMGGGFFSGAACKNKFHLDYKRRVFELTRAMGKDAGQIVIARVPYPIKTWRHSNVMERVDCFNEMLVDIAKEGHYPMVDLMQYVCPTRECKQESEGKPIRPDGLHFDGGGAEDTARWVLGELARLHEAPQ
jgi:hypothetical protein